MMAGLTASSNAFVNQFSRVGTRQGSPTNEGRPRGIQIGKVWALGAICMRCVERKTTVSVAEPHFSTRIHLTHVKVLRHWRPSRVFDPTLLCVDDEPMTIVRCLLEIFIILDRVDVAKNPFDRNIICNAFCHPGN